MSGAGKTRCIDCGVDLGERAAKRNKTGRCHVHAMDHLNGHPPRGVEQVRPLSRIVRHGMAVALHQGQTLEQVAAKWNVQPDFARVQVHAFLYEMEAA